MRISDKTPYRNENGQINFMGRVEGSVKYGLSWYDEVMAQEKVITVLHKVLDRNYILLRNFILPDSDITIPIVLVGPPGIFLISVLPQAGLFSVRDDEWGELTGHTFIPSKVNLVQRLITLGRVLKIYLNRAGFKGELIVEPIMIAVNPGMHIETLRPAARIVLSDAIERFAISITQARPILDADRIADLAVALVKGPPKVETPLPEEGALVSSTVPAGKEIRDKLNPPSEPEQNPPSSFSGDNLGFSYNENGNDQQGQADQTLVSPNRQPDRDQTLVSGQHLPSTPAFEGFDGDIGGFFDNLDLSEGSGTEPAPADAVENAETAETAEPDETDGPGPEEFVMPDSDKPVQKTRFGMTRNQFFILGGILLVWLLLIAAFIYIINL